MLRAALLGLTMMTPMLAAPPALAEQEGWSSQPAPKNRDAWRRQVQLRVEANMANLFRTRGVAGAEAAKARGPAVLQMEILADGSVRNVRITRKSGAGKIDESLTRAASALPRMPAFSPDMTGDCILINLPVRIGR